MATTTDSINWITVLGENYQINLRHRDGSSDKSQWDVGNATEVEIFENTCNKKWGDHECKWGLYYGNMEKVDSNLLPIGKESEFIAKFVCSGSNPWHGYPARPCSQYNGDYPPDNILNVWVENKYIDAHRRRKIHEGHWRI